MITLAHWISPDVLRLLGQTLLHFLWQGAALAALATLAMGICRNASAKYLVGVLCLAGMLAAPVITYVALRNDAASFTFVQQTRGVDLHVSRSKSTHAAVPVGISTAVATGESAYLWLVQLWFLGVLLFSARTAGGVLLIERMRRKESTPTSDAILAVCLRLQSRLGIARAVRYCQSVSLDVPAVVGWIRPVVLLPVGTLAGLSSLQLEAVIAHELAHIRRWDAFVNLFQIGVEALLFYHPAVWWLNKRIREERENCCDDVAIEICGSPLEYARALTRMEETRISPVLSMAANHGSLVSRIRRLLGAPAAASSFRSAGLSVALLFLCVAAAAGHAFFGLAESRMHAASGKGSGELPRGDKDAAFVISASPMADPFPDPKPQANPEPAPAPQEPKPQGVHESYIDSLKSVGLDNLSVDELIGLKVQGITADYVRGLQSEGLKLNADELIGMKVQGITPEYIKELHAAGLHPTGDELIGMKVQGITPEYIRQLKELNFSTDADSLIGMKVQGITPEYIKQMKELNLNADSDSLIGMKVQGITPEYVKEVRELGLKADADGLIGMKVQGVTPVYVKEIQALGLHPDVDDVVGLKVQGVTPQYIKELQALGLKLDVDACISAKIAGVTPEFIQKVRSHGFKDLDLEKIVDLKNAGVLEP